MIKQRIKQLEEQIKEASELYYNSENPIMSDEVFDKLAEELRGLDPSSEVLRAHDWGAEYKEHNGKKLIPHRVKLYTIDRKEKNFEKIKHVNVQSNAMVQYKLDGISATGYYEGGKLIHLLTRNDGKFGYNIMNNVDLRGIENLIEEGDVRFEIVMSWENWKANYNPEVNPSPRNLIAGICGKIEVTELERSIATPVILDVNGDMSKMRTNEFTKWCPMGEVEDKLPKCDYPTDGYIIKEYDEDGEMESVWAFKPTGETAVTEVIDINWSLGNTGKLTPVLTVQAVILSGARIMRVTGNSAKMMEELKCGIGSKVRIRRSGEVIPQIIEVLEPSEDFKLPDFDRREGAHIFRDVTLNMWKNATNFIYWVKGASSSLYNKVQEFYKVNDKESYDRFIQDIKGPKNPEFTVHEWNLMTEAYKILIDMSQQDFLAMLNLPDIGGSAIEKIVKGEKLPSHSERTWNTYRNQVHEVKSHLYLAHGIELAVKVEEVNEIKGYVAITGKHAQIRSSMEEVVRSKGYEVQGSVNKDTNFLIIADVNSTSSKAVNARKLGVTLLSSVEELN